MYSHHNKQILLQTCKKGRLLGQTMIIAEIPVCGEAVEKTFVFSRDKRHVMFVTVFSPEHNAFRKMSSMLRQTLFSNSSPATWFHTMHEFPLRAHTHTRKLKLGWVAGRYLKPGNKEMLFSLLSPRLYRSVWLPALGRTTVFKTTRARNTFSDKYYGQAVSASYDQLFRWLNCFHVIVVASQTCLLQQTTHVAINSSVYSS